MENRDRQVIIRGLKRHSWSNFNRYPKCKDSVIASQGRGGYNTGLTPEEQETLEGELNLPKGELGPFSKYWKDYVIFIMDKDIELDLSKPKDFLDYKILMTSNRVAKSVTKVNETPKAEYVIYDAEEDAKKENLKVNTEKIAYKKYLELTPSEMRNVLKLLGRRSKDVSDTIVDNTINEIIKESPKAFLEAVNLPRFSTHVLIADLLEENMLRSHAGHIYFGDTVMGHDMASAAEFLDDDKNQDIKLSLKAKLEA